MRVTKLGPGHLALLNTDSQGNLIDAGGIPVYQEVRVTPQVAATLLAMPQTPAPLVPFGAYAEAVHSFLLVATLHLIHIDARFRWMIEGGSMPAVYHEHIVFPFWDDSARSLKSLAPVIRRELRELMKMYPLLARVYPARRWLFHEDARATQVSLVPDPNSLGYERLNIELTALKQWGPVQAWSE